MSLIEKRKAKLWHISEKNFYVGNLIRQLVSILISVLVVWIESGINLDHGICNFVDYLILKTTSKCPLASSYPQESRLSEHI